MNKTTEALKLAEKLLSGMLHGTDWNNGTHANIYRPKFPEALDAIREALADQFRDATKMIGCAYCDNPLFAGTKCNNCGRVTLAEPVKQEPVGKVLEGGYEVLLFNRLPEETPLYAAPVDAKAIRADALEEAAKVCDDGVQDFDSWISEGWDNACLNRAAAIRGLK